MAAPTNGFAPPLSQIAFSVIDLRLTERWFRAGFGLLPAGGSRALMRGPLAANVQGLPRAASTCWWLLGRNSWFQLELFQFERPIAKLMPADFRPCDIGYTRIGLWVEDFDATMKTLAGLGSAPLAAPLGERGERRACVRDPDGVYVEIMEDDPLPHYNTRGRVDCPAAIRSVTLSVPQLDDAAAFFAEGIGLKPSSVKLHKPEHEVLWGLAGATTESRLFDGGEVLIEVVHYLDPAGKPRPRDYRVSDQGILNIAFGARRKVDFNAVYRRAEAFGAQPNRRPFHLPGIGSVVYVNDAHGFSVEILRTKPGLSDRIFGFQPRPLHKRPNPDTPKDRTPDRDQRSHRYGRQMNTESPGARHVGVLIIGAGFSGLGAAITLQKDGYTDFLVVERGNNVGGTCRVNTYPGAACDVPSHLYSYSFAPNRNWTRSYSKQPEIEAYIQQVARQHDVLDRHLFDCEVHEVRWDEREARWHVSTSQGIFTANFVVSGVGPLTEPALPDIDGLDEFEGEIFRSARWNHDVDLTGKRVAVIGTGASAIQIVPELAKTVRQLHVYQRTAPWVLPRFDRDYTSAERLAFAHVPGYQRLIRSAMYCSKEFVGFA